MNWNVSCLVGDVATLSCIIDVFARVRDGLLIFAGAVSVIFIIIAGIQFITARADPKKIEGARHTMTYAIAGLLIVLFSFLLINLIAFSTGVECIKFFGFETCK